MIWDRMTIIFRAMASGNAAVREAVRRTVSARARRWSRAAEADEALRHDLIAMGQLLALSTGRDVLAAEPQQLAYEAGKRDLAIELLALMGVDEFDLYIMMKDSGHEAENDGSGRPVA